MGALPSDSKVTQLMNYIIQKAYDGIGPLEGARELAEEYLDDSDYEDEDECVDALIRWETGKSALTGAVSSVGGWITLPIAISGGLAASWIIQARLSMAIAYIYGHRIHSSRVKTIVLCTMVGDSAQQLIKQVAVKTSTAAAKRAVSRISAKVLIDINRKVGFRLLTKAGSKGVIVISRGIPVLGGLVGGTVDAAACRAVGKFARKTFRPKG